MDLIQVTGIIKHLQQKRPLRENELYDIYTGGNYHKSPLPKTLFNKGLLIHWHVFNFKINNNEV